MSAAIIIALYLLGMVVVVGENDQMDGRSLAFLCLVWPAVAVLALVAGLFWWVTGK